MPAHEYPDCSCRDPNCPNPKCRGRHGDPAYPECRAEGREMTETGPKCKKCASAKRPLTQAERNTKRRPGPGVGSADIRDALSARGGADWTVPWHPATARDVDRLEVLPTAFGGGAFVRVRTVGAGACAAHAIVGRPGGAQHPNPRALGAPDAKALYCAAVVRSWGAPDVGAAIVGGLEDPFTAAARWGINAHYEARALFLDWDPAVEHLAHARGSVQHAAAHWAGTQAWLAGAAVRARYLSVVAQPAYYLSSAEAGAYAAALGVELFIHVEDLAAPGQVANIVPCGAAGTAARPLHVFLERVGQQHFHRAFPRAELPLLPAAPHGEPAGEWEDDASWFEDRVVPATRCGAPALTLTAPVDVPRLRRWVDVNAGVSPGAEELLRRAVQGGGSVAEPYFPARGLEGEDGRLYAPAWSLQKICRPARSAAAGSWGTDVDAVCCYTTILDELTQHRYATVHAYSGRAEHYRAVVAGYYGVSPGAAKGLLNALIFGGSEDAWRAREGVSGFFPVFGWVSHYVRETRAAIGEVVSQPRFAGLVATVRRTRPWKAANPAKFAYSCFHFICASVEGQMVSLLLRLSGPRGWAVRSVCHDGAIVQPAPELAQPVAISVLLSTVENALYEKAGVRLKLVVKPFEDVSASLAAPVIMPLPAVRERDAPRPFFSLVLPALQELGACVAAASLALAGGHLAGAALEQLWRDIAAATGVDIQTGGPTGDEPAMVAALQALRERASQGDAAAAVLVGRVEAGSVARHGGDVRGWELDGAEVANLLAVADALVRVRVKGADWLRVHKYLAARPNLYHGHVLPTKVRVEEAARFEQDGPACVVNTDTCDVFRREAGPGGITYAHEENRLARYATEPSQASIKSGDVRRREFSAPFDAAGMRHAVAELGIRAMLVRGSWGCSKTVATLASVADEYYARWGQRHPLVGGCHPADIRVP